MAALLRSGVGLSRSLLQRQITIPALSQGHRLYSNYVIDNTGQSEPSVPEWKAPANETIQSQKARLLYQSRKRGMLENGLLLGTFAARYLQTFTAEQLKIYDTLINKPSNDWELYYWAVGNKPTPEEYNSEVMDLLKKHAKNEDMENRTRQPDLEECM
ncbi:succinate dehydrogenase assembly factor 2, mitochondrial-like [Glandiceps talaboti]